VRRGRAPGAPQLDQWAAGLGLDPAEASAALARHDLVHRDVQTGAISVAYPFSVADTPHRVRLRSGVEVFAMCAIDALGIAFMLSEPTEIASADPGTSDRIEVSLRLTAASAWTPADAVVLAGCVGTGTSRTCTCPHTTFAASREHAQALLEADPQVAGEILSMPEAIIRGRDTFAGLLDHDTQEVSDVDAHRT
jgi:hypothetical protein